MSTQTVTITRLGSEGDGIAEGPVYVPFALPGETVSIARVKNQGTIMSQQTISPDRQEPACRHFGPDGENGICGGCSLQHLKTEPYHVFKARLLTDQLSQRGIETDVRPLITIGAGERRRAVFAARRTEKSLLLGFSQSGSHHIVDLVECPVMSPGIMARFPALRTIGKAVASNAEPFRITVIETLSGLDLSIDGVKALEDRQRRMAIEIILGEKGIARVSVNGEVLVEPERPLLDFGGVKVAPPPGAFTQASIASEEAMAELVLAALGKAKTVADLFAGCGTFALRIARKAAVHAVESDAAALTALDQAARRAQGLKPVTVERRDLYRRPMMPMDLKKFDAVVFDPPRAGAESQSAELARSQVRKIVAVSCNPVTLARDLSILISGGYRVTSVTPIDQFLWTGHVEAVAVLEKA